jgi:hypothetical protein
MGSGLLDPREDIGIAGRLAVLIEFDQRTRDPE